jgi:hypothetical protein
MHHNDDLSIIVNGIVPRFISVLNDLIRTNRHDTYDRKLHDWNRIINEGNTIFICINNDDRIVGTVTVYQKTTEIAVICDLAILSSLKKTIIIEHALLQAARQCYGHTVKLHAPCFGRCTYENFSNITHIEEFLCSNGHNALSEILDQQLITLITGAPTDHNYVKEIFRLTESIISEKIATPQIEDVRRFIFALMEADMLMHTSCA